MPLRSYYSLQRTTPSLRTCPPTGVAGVARTDPRPKAPPPTGSRQGQKRRIVTVFDELNRLIKNSLPAERGRYT